MKITADSSDFQAVLDPRVVPAQKRLLALYERFGSWRKVTSFLGLPEKDVSYVNAFVRKAVVPANHEVCRMMGIPRRCWRHWSVGVKHARPSQPDYMQWWAKLPKHSRHRIIKDARARETEE